MIRAFLKLLFGSMAAPGGDPSVTLGSATITGMVDGLPNAPLVSADEVIKLSGNTFKAIGAGTDVTGWFTNLPGGLTAAVKDAVAQGANTITITLSGTPAAANAANIAVIIPKAVLTNTGSDIRITPTVNAAYRIDNTIRSIADFEAFARVVNESDYGRSVSLLDKTTVINVPSTADYIPIARPVMGPDGKTLIYHPYTGTLDGSGGTINVDIEGDASYLALLGANNGRIKNCTVTGSVKASIDEDKREEGLDYVAGVVAYNDIHGHIEQVVSKVTVTAEDADIHNIGGIAGFNGWDKFSNHSPHFDPKSPNYQTGGDIHQCRNEGTVEGGGNKIGGIAGENAGDITECANYGEIICHKINEGHPRWPGVGGIAGRNGNNNDAIEQGQIRNCYNRGTITDKTAKNMDHNDYGGITGFCDGDQNTSAKNCYTTGPFDEYEETAPGQFVPHPLTGTKNPIIGSVDLDKATMADNNYALDTIVPASSEDPLLRGTPKDADYMKGVDNGDFVDDLNKDPSAPFVKNPAPEGGYPILKWELGNLPPADPDENKKKN